MSQHDADVSDGVPLYQWSRAEGDERGDEWADNKNKAAMLTNPAEVRDYYNRSCSEYDEYLSPGRYNGPRYLADALIRHVPVSGNIHILDVAAGTGMVGEELFKRGFRRLDALDPAENMLLVAKQKKIYGDTYAEYMGNERTSIADDTYDVLVCSGGFVQGHMPCVALAEMVRVVKPGGLVLVVMGHEYLSTVSEFNGRLEAYMERFVEQDVWRCLEKRVVPCYVFGRDGLIAVFRVNQSGEPSKPEI